MSDEDLNENDGASEGGEGADGEEGEGKKGGLNAKKIVLFFILPLFLLAAVGGGLYFTGIIGGGGADAGADTEQHAGDGHDDGHGGKKSASKKGHDDGHGGGYSSGSHFLEIPNMIVNLSGKDGQTRYLRLSVQLELKSSSDKDAVGAVMPRVVDQFQTYLRELRIKDLQGSQGIYRLQMELLSRVNAAAYPVEVQDVLFQEILIQ